ncbi:TetR family transcriptional regulator [Izhakiella australiensis]|uniref:TetR family transcriptional regulator n=1 Tax=Izhakiella australiensis TaxID=1926881 RepID=A0A1S8YSG5_9GAMM|nr:TetR/AcrR family transcriptional regulator [Izhakiella australiensis]OON42121.1 TetR family transcriptional regulator [Izhakiella australiensis]
MQDKKSRPGPRPGGRSALVQAAVHRAVREIQAEGDEAQLTFPAIAVRAGVTPSTLYRRWGTLPELLSDVMVENLRPDKAPEDLGCFRADLSAWIEQYIEEISSVPGRNMLRTVLCADKTQNNVQCATYTLQQIEMLRSRALARGEKVPSADTVLDRLVAPLVYRLLFSAETPGPQHIARLVDAMPDISP